MKPNKNLAVFVIHEVKAVLFDKDGTILDFDKTWRTLWDELVSNIQKEFNLSDEVVAQICEKLGVLEDGFTSDSVYVQNNYDEMLAQSLDNSSISDENKKAIRDYINNFVYNHASDYTKAHAIPGVQDTIKAIKQQGFIVGLVTSDLEEIAMKHLHEVGLLDVFDYIACDDGVRAVKPDPEILHDFCNKFDLLPHEVAMVGDTMVDVEFAKNNGMGYAIYVRSGYPDDKAEKLADMILEDVNQLVVSK